MNDVIDKDLKIVIYQYSISLPPSLKSFFTRVERREVKHSLCTNQCIALMKTDKSLVSKQLI